MYRLQWRLNDCILPGIAFLFIFIVYCYLFFPHNDYVTKQQSSLSPVAARSKAWVCGRSLTGIAVSKPIGGMDVCLF
jgi:hypothetical protein